MSADLHLVVVERDRHREVGPELDVDRAGKI